MIAYPIAYPMGSDRAYPNRPRIARVESSRVVPFSWLGFIHDLRLLGRPSQKRMAAVAALSRGVR